MKTTMKLIKTIALMMVLTIFCKGALFAQKSGIFKTYADFQAGKMEYGIDCAKEKHKIKLHDFFGKDFITVVHEGKSYDLKKAETWGYQLCDNKLARFQGKEYYEVGDQGVLWIYTKEASQTVGGKTPATKTVTNYYFSKGGNGEIKPLTLMNLKAAFPDNHTLHDAIDTQFKSDNSLNEFDQFHKHYKLNHFLETKGIKE